MQDLDSKVEDVAVLYEETLRSGNESRAMAKATYLEALATFTDASSIVIPPIDADGLKTEGEPLAWGRSGLG